MLYLRSILFLVYMYGLLALMGIAYIPLVLFGGRPAALDASRRWPRWTLKGLRVIAGMTVEVRGAERIPPGGVLIASKHQSMWESLFYMAWFADPSIVIKKELLSLPLYGWYARKCDLIAVDRDKGASALKDMLSIAERHLKAGRPVIIFPEGTRVAPGAAPDYKPGIAALYARLNVPCVPVALNSGLYWINKGLMRRPGRVIVEFLDPIPPGLDRKAFMARLEASIEAASARLLEEAKSGGVHRKTAMNITSYEVHGG